MTFLKIYNNKKAFSKMVNEILNLNNNKMPKPKKELKAVAELYAETISKYTLDERVKLHSLLSLGIKNEAQALKNAGDKAVEILSNLENGKA